MIIRDISTAPTGVPADSRGQRPSIKGKAVSLTHILVVALIQGVTEFLPISSHAHLILLPRMTGWCDQGLVVEIAVHVGTLAAVVVYFRRESWGMLRGAAALAAGRRSPEARLFAFVILASLPVGAAGYVLEEYLHLQLRSVALIGWATLGFGILLWVADRWFLTIRRIEHMDWRAALIIGLFQTLALVPGTSRSGITMTAARLLGFERPEAARFSLLMSIPVILAAGTLAGIDLAREGSVRLTFEAALAALLAFIAALLAIAAMMGWLRRATFAPFVAYRIVLGAALLAAVYGFGIGAESVTAACPA